MKKLHLSFLLISFFLLRCITSQAQVNLPYTLAFSSDDPAPSINARQQNRNILVEWKVENESGIQKYDVERSSDGKVFTGVATQMAAGDYGTATTYHWLDQNVLRGNNFYRIKSIAATGREAYSSIIKMYSGSAEPALLIYPNPATTGIVYLQMNNMPVGTYHVNVVNTAGQVILTKLITHDAGSSNETLNFSNLAKGVYLLEVIHPDHSKSKSTIVY